MKGDAWLFSLRRLPYPDDKEFISCFHFGGDEWKEQFPVTASAGFYEAPCSACAEGGKPVVAWIEIGEDNKQWNVYASAYTSTGFSKPVKVSNSRGKATNPKIRAIDDKTSLLV